MSRASQSVNSMRFVVEKVCFVNKLPLLSKATSDDENPTPGYLYQEICDLSLECDSYCNDLLDYLVSRLEHDSYHVKLKVLRIMRYIVENSKSDFCQKLKRKAHGIRDATKFGGPPDLLHGNAPYLLVRKEAKELCSILFDTQTGVTDDNNQPSFGSQMPSSSSSSTTLGGMGTGLRNRSSNMQGFGNTPLQPQSLGASFVEGLKDLANKVLEPSGYVAEINISGQQANFNRYKPVQLMETMEETVSQHPITSNRKVQQTTNPSQVIKSHKPGVAGGGWEDTDEYVNNEDLQCSNSQEISIPDDDRVDKIDYMRCDSPENDDSAMEQQLVRDTINKETLLLKRQDIEDFIKRCSAVNCSKVVEALEMTMSGTSHIFQMHSLQLCEALLRIDLISPDELANTCALGLMSCYRSQHQQTKIKAKKVIRILEKLCADADIISSIITKVDSQQIDPEQNLNSVPNVSNLESDEDLYESSFYFIKPAFATFKNSHPLHTRSTAECKNS